jgi:hypothetical protein
MRFIVTLDNPPEGLNANTRLLFLFLKSYESKHGKGAEKDRALLFLDVTDKTFKRCWETLKAEHLIKVA